MHFGLDNGVHPTLDTLAQVMKSVGVSKSEYYRIRVESKTSAEIVKEVSKALQDAGYVKFVTQMK